MVAKSKLLNINNNGVISQNVIPEKHSNWVRMKNPGWDLTLKVIRVFPQIQCENKFITNLSESKMRGLKTTAAAALAVKTAFRTAVTD